MVLWLHPRRAVRASPPCPTHINVSHNTCRYTGYPLFPGENEVEQLACIMEVIGVPPRHLIESSSRAKMFFDSSLQPRIVANSRGKKRRPGSRDLSTALRCTDAPFLSFLEGCLRWDSTHR